MGCQPSIRLAKSTNYKPTIQLPTLILGEDLTTNQFLRGDKGGDTCFHVDFIIMTSKKPRGSFGKMGQEKKIPLWDSSMLILS
jgi:hypothetical protein